MIIENVYEKKIGNIIYKIQNIERSLIEPTEKQIGNGLNKETENGEKEPNTKRKKEKMIYIID